MSTSLLFLLIGALLIGLEAIISVDGYFLLLGIAGLLTSLLAYFFPLLSLAAGAVIFCFLSVFLVGIYKVYKHYNPDLPEVNNLNIMAARYIGKLYTIVEVFDDGSAKIQIDDSLWRVRSETAQTLKIGSKVRVIDQLSSTELKVISGDAIYEQNPRSETPDSIQHLLQLLYSSRSAKKHAKLIRLFNQLHQLYNNKPDFSFERSAFYHSYLPQTVEVFKKLDTDIKLDKEEQVFFGNALKQLSERFEEIIDVYNNNKKDKLLAKIDVLNSISKH